MIQRYAARDYRDIIGEHKINQGEFIETVRPADDGKYMLVADHERDVAEKVAAAVQEERNRCRNEEVNPLRNAAENAIRWKTDWNIKLEAALAAMHAAQEKVDNVRAAREKQP